MKCLFTVSCWWSTWVLKSLNCKATMKAVSGRTKGGLEAVQRRRKCHRCARGVVCSISKAEGGADDLLTRAPRLILAHREKESHLLMVQIQLSSLFTCSEQSYLRIFIKWKAKVLKWNSKLKCCSIINYLL